MQVRGGFTHPTKSCSVAARPLNESLRMQKLVACPLKLPMEPSNKLRSKINSCTQLLALQVVGWATCFTWGFSEGVLLVFLWPLFFGSHAYVQESTV